MLQIAHPFVKWAGGKSQLLDKIREKYPQKIKKYCEPFVGGGAVLFDILNNFQPEKILINDINKDLINTYNQVRDNPDMLISKLAELQDIYRNQSSEKNKELFYEKRSRFNELKISENDAENLEKAVLFIFLNKTCFNGLYRVNKKASSMFRSTMQKTMACRLKPSGFPHFAAAHSAATLGCSGTSVLQSLTRKMCK